MGTKICHICHKEKVIEDFVRRQVSPDGFSHVCKECHCAKQKEYHHQHKDVINARARERRAANPELIRSKERERRKLNSEKVAIQRRASHERNRENRNAQARAKYHREPEVFKNNKLMNTYGISLEEYKELYEQQNGVCAICGKSETNGKSLSVDHNHDTGEIRGLLCQKCNQGIGLFSEDVNLMNKAIEYLVVRPI